MAARLSGGCLTWEEHMPLQVFVTGVYGSGKTHFAQQLSSECQIAFQSFDGLHDYTSQRNQSRAMLDNLPSEYVIDAIPVDDSHTWSDFIDYEASHPVAVVCVSCPDKNVWLKRIRDKQIDRIAKGRSGLMRLVMVHLFMGRKLWHQESSWPGGHLKRIWGYIKTWVSKIRHAEGFVAGIDEKVPLTEYRCFFQAFPGRFP